MRFHFSEHAKKQVKKRNISQSLILTSAKNPEEILSSYLGRKLRRRRVGGKILEVVTKTEGSKITIVTAYYLEENL